MTNIEREIKGARKEAARHSQEIQELWKKAKDDDNRDATPEEQEEILEHVKAIETIKVRLGDLEAQHAVEQEVKRVGREMGPAEEVVPSERLKSIQVQDRQKTIGQIFVESEGFKSIQENRGQTFSTGPVHIDTKAGTLLSGTLAPGSGQGGGLLTVPQVAPGVVEKLFQRTTVADIIPKGNTNTNTVRYVVEGTATSGAAAVAEGGAKPASDLALSTVDEQVKKVATILTVSDEMLEDAAQVESYIDRRLRLFLEIEEERELLRGSTAAEIPGIIGRSGVNTYARGTVDNNAVALFKAINGTRGSAFLEPDYIIMHPDNWQTTRLLQDDNNQFYGGGPFTGAYGNNQNLQDSGQLTGSGDSIWNKPVLVTTAPGSGTALLGSFGAAAMIYRRSGISVEASNAHASYFVSNLVAIRAEMREALCVYRPGAFTTVTGLA
jgi:HK97 family phage major capsid protein